MVALAFYLVDGKTPPFGTDIAIAFGLALVSMLVAPLLDVDGDAFQSAGGPPPLAAYASKRTTAMCRA